MDKLWEITSSIQQPRSGRRSHWSCTCKRGFCQFIYEPIRTVIDAAMNDEKDKLFSLLEKLEVLKLLKPEDKELMGKPLMKRVMQSWLPAHAALLER
eukprot:jgi/Picre1/33720/NNA_001199.t1